jgi:hypothetical protein
MPRSNAGGRRRIPLVAPPLAALIAIIVAASWWLAWSRSRPPSTSTAAAMRPGVGAAVEFDRFSARHERNETEERLSVSLRLRQSGGTPRRCFLFVVARNDRLAPKLWAIWPPQAPGPAITAGGHFHGATPTTGYSFLLTEDWQRVTATVPETSTRSFDTVVVYVVGEDGRLLLSRPFRV